MQKLLQVFLTLVTIVTLWGSANAQAPLSGVYTINPSLPAGNRNYQSFGRAAIALESGISGPVVFNVAENSPVFEEQVNFYSVTGASAVNTITINGNGNTMHFLSTDSYSMAGIKLDGAKHFIIDSLTIKTETAVYNQDYGVGVQLLRDADSNTIRKCKIIIPTTQDTYQQTIGIFISVADDIFGTGLGNSNDNVIYGNTIEGAGIGVEVSGFYQYDFTNMEFCVNNQVINNVIRDFFETGIQLTTCANTLVQGNDISSKTTLGDVNGILVSLFSKKNSVFNNIVHDLGCATSGTTKYFATSECYLGIAGEENAYVNNLAYSDSVVDNTTAFDFTGLAHSANIFHNTVYFKAQGTGTFKGVNFDAPSSALFNAGINIENNIFYIAGGTATVYGMYIKTTALSGSKVERNNYLLTGATAVTGYYLSKSYTSLTSWQAVSAYDLESNVIDPVFADAANHVFKPTATNLDNRAAAIGIATDLAGVARNTTHPDMGAYEFGTPGCTTPLTVGATVIAPGTTICEGANVGLDLSGNTSGNNQTYQWVRSATATGTFSNVSDAAPSATNGFIADSTCYIKAMVTCGTDVKYSDAVLLTVNPRLKPGHYTIDKTQPTNGINYASFAEAINSMACGIKGPVVFDVVPGSGPYTENFVVPAITNSSVINTITFNGNGETLTHVNDKNIVSAIYLNNTKHIVIYNFNVSVSGTNSVTTGIRIGNYSDSNIIRKCTVTNAAGTSSYQACIAISGYVVNSYSLTTAAYCNYNIIDSNTLIGSYRSIQSTTADGTPMYGNVISNNIIKDFGESGIYVAGQTNMSVINNDISRPTATIAYSGYGINGSTLVSCFISGNRIHDMAKATPATTKDVLGVYLAGTDPAADGYNTVQNNLIYNLTAAGKVVGINDNGVNYTRYYHNTVVLDDVSQSVNKETEGFYLVGATTGTELKNNLIVVKRKMLGTTVSYAVRVAAASTISFDNNDYLRDETNSYSKTGRFVSADCATLANWKTAIGQDANAVAIDPVFTDAANGNYKPTAGALGDKGIGVGVVRDILGTRRNTSTPDVGAYEFTCTYPAAADAVADSIAICKGSSANFEVKNPETGVTYRWYDSSYYPYEAEGTLLQSGTQFTTPSVTTDSVIYYLEAIAANGCGNAIRVPVKAVTLQPLTIKPVVTTTGVTGETASFAWNAVPGATGYLVSRNYVDFTLPSSGAGGRTHTVTGLKGGDTLSLVVKATADIECQAIVSDSAFARTFTDNFFVPNMFTPNGDGMNDEFKVYGNTITALKLMVFNQWGEKVFETSDRYAGWNGTYSGKPLPVGVYIYVAQMTFSNGAVKSSKGSLSLIR